MKSLFLIAALCLVVSVSGVHHSADSDVESEILSPFMAAENELINQNQQLLSSMELIAHQLGAPVLSELAMEANEHEVDAIQHSLIAADASAKIHSSELSAEEMSLPAALLEQAPVAEAEDTPAELKMMELSAELSLPKQNDYAYLDDPKHGGNPTRLKNLEGIDIYVVNTPIKDNENEIRPVKPPHALSAVLRERARQAALLRKQLIHDIPEPKAQVKPKTRINTLSAYEPSLVDSRPLKKLGRLTASAFDNPIYGGHGALQLKGSTSKKDIGAGARFQQLGADLELPGTGSLPAFPAEPAAAGPVSVVGVGSSFDNRDGPPVLVDELLPIKATLVEDLDPLGLQPKESQPKGWGSKK